MVFDHGYMGRAEQVVLFPDAANTLRELKARGFLLVVVSNQSGIGCGLITEAQAREVSKRFCELLATDGVVLDAVLWCPHAPDDGCQCRKPSPGMLIQAADALGIDFKESYMVGDRLTDCEAGVSVGCTPVLLHTDSKNGKVPDEWHTIGNLSDLLAII